MKITQVISDSNIGGAGVLLSMICEGLCEKFDTEIIIPKGSSLKRRLTVTGAKITELRISKDKTFSPVDALTLLWHFRKSRPDIIHSHASLSARLAGRLLGNCVCVSTRHCAWDLRTKRPSHLKSLFYEMLTDITVSTADCATENLLFEGISQSKIRTIKNGTHALTPPSEEEKRALRESLGFKQDELILGVCSRLESVKGHDLTLRAVSGLYYRIPKIRLLVVGAGSREPFLKRQAARLGISHICRFLGFRDNPAMYQSLFYINLNASRGTETSCLATSECMSLGIPTVASDFGGNKEQIENGVNGLLFRNDDPLDLENALFRILSDEGLYSRLSEGARQRFYERFSASSMLYNYEKLYNSLKY